MIYFDDIEKDRWWIIYMLIVLCLFGVFCWVYGYFVGRDEKQIITETQIIYRSTP